MNQIEFKKYAFWPNIKKMDKMFSDGLSNYELLGFCFEVSITKEQKLTNAYFTGHFFIDFDGKNRTVNFDIPSVENETGNLFLYHIKNEKKSNKKVVAFENGKEKVTMKSEPVKTVFNSHLTYNNLINSFIECDIKPHIESIKKFFDINKIDYNQKEFDTHIQEIIQEVEKFFSGKLNISIEDKFYEVVSILTYEKMNNELNQKEKKKTLKI